MPGNPNAEGWWQADDGTWYPPQSSGAPTPPQSPTTPQTARPNVPAPPYNSGAPRSCANCGTPVADHVVFCPTCGTSTAGKRGRSNRPLRAAARKKWLAVVLAVIFAYFTFLYTWQFDRKKFWISLGVVVFSQFLGDIGLVVDVFVWGWSVYTQASRPSAFFERYPFGESSPRN